MGEPLWLKSIFDAYNSKASNVFLLYGNTSDLFLGKEGEKSLKDYIEEKGGARRIVLHADPASGLTIERGRELLPKMDAGGEVMEAVHYLLSSLANLQGEIFTPTVFITNAGYLIGTKNEAQGALLLKRWSEDPFFRRDEPFIVLIADNLKDVHPLIQNNQRIEKIEVPFPSEEEVATFLQRKKVTYPEAFSEIADQAAADRLATAMTGTSLQGLESLIKKQAFRRKPLRFADLESIKQKLMQQESQGLIEFLSPKNTLDDLLGTHNVAIKAQFEGDIALWNEEKFALIPNGVLLIGPMGTGKTYFVRCLAGTAAKSNIPIIKLNNFREQYQGLAERNLELIFRLTKSLRRVYLFIDEADANMGNRGQGSDGGVSSRLYAMFAQEMSNLDNKGRICWLLATSHPHLLEPDIKRPGRIDVKIPLLPCENREAAIALLTQMGKRAQLSYDVNAFGDVIPDLLTPRGANTITEMVIRRKMLKKGVQDQSDIEILNDVLRS